MSTQARKIPGREGDVEFVDYSQTPGGTIYGTTPGGTKIKYNKDTLLKLSKSPLSNTSPHMLPDIPGVTSPAKGAKDVSVSPPPIDLTETGTSGAGHEEDVFAMEN